MAKPISTDLLNDPILLARNMAFQQVQYFVRAFPNELGQIDRRKQPVLTQEEIRRLAGK